MASYSVEFSANVRKDFRKIPEAEADRILRKIRELSTTPRPPGSRKLKGEEVYLGRFQEKPGKGLSTKGAPPYQPRAIALGRCGIPHSEG
jgi:hypothetical protein